MNNKFIGFAVLVFMFLMGALTSQAVSLVERTPAKESPLLITGPKERYSPSDTIKEDQIKVYKNGVYVSLKDGNDEWLVQLDLNNPSWSTFTDTNSMDPVIDVGANTIRIRTPCDELTVGDIISYQHEQGIIIHRIVHIDHDEQGPYFITKGDNNPLSDPVKVRCEQYLGKVVAIFY